MANTSDESKDLAEQEIGHAVADPKSEFPHSPDLPQPSASPLPMGFESSVGGDDQPISRTQPDLRTLDTADVAERIRYLNRFFDQTPASHPKYRVLELIGRGGMGGVFKAEQRSPIKRLVALKLVKPGFDSREVIARFESERQALARMDHGSVAKVFDAGADDMGRPYFVMEYVPGIAITDFADQNKLTIKQRLELFVDVCSAIAHAHSKGILHRDIKATNVLAYFSDGKPVVKVIDFGVAKALSGERLTDATMNTRYGQLLGTYQSMSPEQAEGSPDIDTRTDVYSLGVLLYELLTGVAPFDKEVFNKSADQEIRRIIQEVEPPRPSTRLTSMGDTATKVATARQAPLNALADELRSELEWIPLMAMRKSRDRRYASPLELSDDIQRYLEHRPLRAGPESMWYVARKTLRRHRFAVAAALAVFVSLAAGLIVSTYLLLQVIEQKAVIARDIEEIENSMAFGGDYEAARNDPISARRLYANALDELRAHNEASSAVLAGLSEIESTDRGQIPLLGSFGNDGDVMTFRGHTSHPNNVVVLPEFRALTAGNDGQLYLWDLLRGRAVLNKPSQGDKSVAYVAISADGMLAATAGDGGNVGLWEVQTLNEHAILKKTNDKPLWMVAISPNGRRIVAGTFDGELWVWEKNSQWQEGVQLFKAAESIAAIAFPPGESRYAMIGDPAGALTLWDLEENKPLWSTPEKERHHDHVNSVAFSSDGAKAATASFDGTATLWDVQGSGSTMHLVFTHVLKLRPRAWRVAFSPDGKKLAVGADSGTAAVYDVESGELLRPFTAQRNSFHGVAFVDNNTLLSTGDDAMGADRRSLVSALRMWDLSNPGTVLPAATKSPAKRVSVDDTGRTQIELTSGEMINASFGPDGRVRPGPENSQLVLSEMHDKYAAALQQASWWKGGSRISALSQTNSPGGGSDDWQELSAVGDGSVRFFVNSRNELELRAVTGGPSGAESALVHLRTLRGHRARIVAAAISPNGRFIVSIDQNGRCLGWDLLRPALCRYFEQTLSTSPGSGETAILKKWYTFRGREDLATRVQ